MERDAVAVYYAVYSAGLGHAVVRLAALAQLVEGTSRRRLGRMENYELRRLAHAPLGVPGASIAVRHVKGRRTARQKHQEE